MHVERANEPIPTMEGQALGHKKLRAIVTAKGYNHAQRETVTVACGVGGTVGSRQSGRRAAGNVAASPPARARGDWPVSCGVVPGVLHMDSMTEGRNGIFQTTLLTFSRPSSSTARVGKGRPAEAVNSSSETDCALCSTPMTENPRRRCSEPSASEHQST